MLRTKVGSKAFNKSTKTSKTMTSPSSALSATQTAPTDLVKKIAADMKNIYGQTDKIDFTVADTSTNPRQYRVTLTLNNGIQPSPYRKAFESMFKSTGIDFLVQNGLVSMREKTAPTTTTENKRK